MMDTSFKAEIANTLRSSSLQPMQAGSVLSLLLLWSQTDSPKRKELPSFQDVSAEFLLRDPKRVARSLLPENSEEVVRSLTVQRPSDLEALRRIVMNALSAQIPIDEIAETILAHCAPYEWASGESSSALIAALDPKKGTQIKCAFSFAMRMAWALSKDSHVTLDVENSSLSAVLSALAAACSRSLHVRVDSIDLMIRPDDEPEDGDHALIVPPLGMRKRLDHALPNFPGSSAGDQVGTETLGALWGARLGRSRNIVVVGNGLLFRTSSKDAAFKQELLFNHGLEAIISLPRGILPGTAVATSALVFSGTKQAKRLHPFIRFIEASDPEALNASLLADLIRGKKESALCVDVSIEDISNAGFNLSVDRYVLDAKTRETREALKGQETAKLSDIADIRRPQALPRHSKGDPALEIREALLADIDDGRLNLPAKLSELPRSALTKIEGTIVKPGDILLSIKGTIGKAALVTENAIAESTPTPIIPGQSFVIIRLRKGSLISDPRILMSYLRSPAAQSLLQGMAGGTTIPNVAMGELKGMPVPIQKANIQTEILKKFHEYYNILRGIDVLRREMKSIENEMFNMTLTGK